MLTARILAIPLIAAAATVAVLFHPVGREFSHWLWRHTSHNPWDWVAASGSTVVAVTAVVGGIVALKSYVATSRATAHMHDIFRSYLSKRRESRILIHEFEAEPGLSGEERQERNCLLNEELAGYLLYSLEEMYAWLKLEEERNHSFWSFRGRRIRRRRADLLGAWNATIVTHLIQERKYAIDSLVRYSACYSHDFMTFANDYLRSRRLATLIERDRVVRSHAERQLGTVERKELPAAKRKAFYEARGRRFT